MHVGVGRVRLPALSRRRLRRADYSVFMSCSCAKRSVKINININNYRACSVDITSHAAAAAVRGISSVSRLGYQHSWLSSRMTLHVGGRPVFACCPIDEALRLTCVFFAEADYNPCAPFSPPDHVRQTRTLLSRLLDCGQRFRLCACVTRDVTVY